MKCVTQTFQAMGTQCELHLYGKNENATRRLIALAISEVKRLEEKYTRYSHNSETSRINRSAGSTTSITVDDETTSILNYSAIAYQQSGGLFDITSWTLRNLWKPTQKQLPTPSAIAKTLKRIGWQHVHWDPPNLHLPIKGMEIDFGGVVKEYAVDAVVALCQKQGYTHGLIDMGGDIGVIGPHPDGKPWRIGIRNPHDPLRAKALIELSQGSLATSGDYERYFEIHGKRYSHILNPLTGWPVQGLISVSVQAPLCIVAGTASTIGMLKGKQEGIHWLDALGLPYFCIKEDGTNAYSDSINTP